MNIENPTNPENPYNPEQGKQAYDAVAPQLEDLAPTALRRVNIDVYQAGVRGVAVDQQLQDPAVGSVFDELAPRFWQPEHKRLLGKLAWALVHCVTEAKRAGESANTGLVTMTAANAGMELRRTMLKVAEYNLGGDPQLAALFKRLREGAGYFDLAEDLQILARVYQEHAAALTNDRFFQLGHVDEANAIVANLFEYLGAQQSEKTWQLQVRRCWTLFAASYEEIYRVAQFIFHKDPARLAHFPNLYTR